MEYWFFNLYVNRGVGLRSETERNWEDGEFGDGSWFMIVPHHES